MSVSLEWAGRLVRNVRQTTVNKRRTLSWQRGCQDVLFGSGWKTEKTFRKLGAYAKTGGLRKGASKRNWNHFYRFGQHFKYILDTGFYWGERLEPGPAMMKDGVKAIFMPDAEAATAWLYYSLDEVAKMSHILGKPEDEEIYTKWAELVKHVYRKEYIKGSRVK